MFNTLACINLVLRVFSRGTEGTQGTGLSLYQPLVKPSQLKKLQNHLFCMAHLSYQNSIVFTHDLRFPNLILLLFSIGIRFVYT